MSGHIDLPDDAARPAPVALASPEPGMVAPPSTLPSPPAIASEPEPAAAAGGDTILSIPDPVHYPAKDLDVYPQASKRITPVYPQAARDTRITGSVTLLVLIDEAGRVVSTSVTDAAPDGVFEQAAQHALENAAFYPAQKDGRPVRSRILVKIEFDDAIADAAH